jgi:alkylation response protein AidB-like acyl-CoA dehydrogenase
MGRHMRESAPSPSAIGCPRSNGFPKESQATEEAVKYVKGRRAFRRAIGNFQGMRWKIAEMYRDIEASHSLLYRACASADPFPDPLLAR